MLGAPKRPPRAAWLALLCMAVLCPAVQGEAQVVEVRTAGELTDALWNASAHGCITLLADIDYSQEIPRWKARGRNVLLETNLIIAGLHPASYPLLNFSYWEDEAGSALPGIVLGANVTLVFHNVLLKRITRFIPDIVRSADPTALVLCHDCLYYKYTSYPLPAHIQLLASLPYPVWATGEASYNQLAALPAGYCTAGRAEPRCWGTAMFIHILATDWVSTAERSGSPAGAVVRVCVWHSVEVAEQALSLACLQRLLEGNATCQEQVESRLAADEATMPGGWLAPVAPAAWTAAALEGYIRTLSTFGPLFPVHLPLWLQSAEFAMVREPPFMLTACSAAVLLVLIATLAVHLHRRATAMATARAAEPVICTNAPMRGATPLSVSDGPHSPEARKQDDAAETGTAQLVALPHLEASELAGPSTQQDPACLLLLPGPKRSGDGGSSSMQTQSDGASDACANQAASGTLARLQDLITPATPMRWSVPLQDVRLGVDVVVDGALGAGGTSTVHAGLWHGRRVAVKLLHPAAEPGSLQHELAVLSRVQHPNIVRLLAAQAGEQGPPLLVQELTDGSLEQLLYPSNHAGSGGGSLPVLPRPLPVGFVLALAADIASGLAYLHPTVVHRDLKPGNVLLVRQGAQLLAKITDFGLARCFDGLAFITGHPYAGTVQYMAPECFTRSSAAGLTHKCDIYSLGVLIWEMVSGTRPWEGLSPAEVIYSVVILKMRPTLNEDGGHCSRGLCRLIARCWDEDPHRRPPALEVVRELAVLQRAQQQGMGK